MVGSSPRRNVRRSLLAGLVLVLALGACGSGTKTASRISTAALVAGAADKAAAEKTVKVTGHETFTVQGKERTVPIDGAVDFATGAADLTVDASSLGLRGLGSIRARMIDGVMYMDFGALLRRTDTPAPLRGKTWLKLDTAQLGGNGGSGSGAAGILQSLRGAGDVREVGTERIDGVDTRHFHATVDTSKAIARVRPGPLRDLAEKGLSEMGPTYPVDVWIDGDGLPRRLALRITTTMFTMSETVDYRDYGHAVEVQVPPASETADYSELLSLVGASPSTN